MPLATSAARVARILGCTAAARRIAAYDDEHGAIHEKAIPRGDHGAPLKSQTLETWTIGTAICPSQASEWTQMCCPRPVRSTRQAATNPTRIGDRTRQRVQGFRCDRRASRGGGAPRAAPRRRPRGSKPYRQAAVAGCVCDRRSRERRRDPVAPRRRPRSRRFLPATRRNSASQPRTTAGAPPSVSARITRAEVGTQFLQPGKNPSVRHGGTLTQKNSACSGIGGEGSFSTNEASSSTGACREEPTVTK
eukprot:5967766-Prymnesium_polylepis.1